jgi:hypothetical protein
MVTKVEGERSVPADEESDTGFGLESVRDIKPAFPHWKYILVSVLMVLVSCIIYVVYQ